MSQSADISSFKKPNHFIGLMQLWFGLSHPVSRRAYLLSGLGLMAFKYLADALAIYWASDGHVLSLWQFLSPLITSHNFGPKSELILWALAIWTLPYMWIGISMSVRRAENAGISPWLALFFFVPFVNYLLMLYLAVLPSAPARKVRAHEREQANDIHLISVMLKGTAVGVLLTLSMTGLAVYVFGSYGSALFFGTPFIIGATTAYILNRHQQYSFKSTAALACWSLACAALALLLFAFEGAICIAMVFPLACVASLMGAAVGRHIASGVLNKPSHVCIAILALPFLAITERPLFNSELFEVVTSIEINAVVEEVWPLVVGFSEIPAPPSLVLRSGLAYPLRARIDGSGVGAIRHCEFSTGAFVEPITRWEPPTRLSFDVAAQPPAMQEWSPYNHLHPPHLDGYFKSKRGEFRLSRLSDNRTYLEGSTWYELDLYPSTYWRLLANFVIHQIHNRVLNHIKYLAEDAEGK